MFQRKCVALCTFNELFLPANTDRSKNMRYPSMFASYTRLINYLKPAIYFAKSHLGHNQINRTNSRTFK